MKKIVSVVVVLVLLLVVAPWGIGRVAEKRVNAGLDQLVEEAPYLKIVDRKWTGGWFRSEQEVTFEVFGDMFRAMEAIQNTGNTQAPPVDAEVVEATDEALPAKGAAPPKGPKAAKEAKVQAAPAPAEEAAAADAADEPSEPAEPAKPAEPLRFTVRNEILHGPVLWPAGLGIARVNTRLVLDEKIRKQIAEIFGTEEPVRISSRVGFLGGGSTRFSGEGRKIKLKKEAGTITYDDFRLDIGYSGKFNKLDYDGKWPRLVFDDPAINSSMLVEGMSLTGRSERTRGDLYDGDVRFAIDKVSITDAEKSVTSIDGIHYIVDSKTKDDFMTVSAKLGSGKVVNKALKEIKLDLNEVHNDFTMRRLHAETLEKFVAAMKNMYTQPMTTAEEVDVNFVKPFKENGVALLSHDPEFAIDRLGIVTPDGEGVIKGVIRPKGLTAEDFSPAAPGGWLRKIEADLTFEAAQKLLEKIPNGATGAGMAVDQGFAKREGDKLVSHIIFKDSRLTVNGKDVPIPGLGGGPAQPAPPEG